MGKPLKALMVEDVEKDVLLAVRELQRGGFDVSYEQVETPEAMSAALTRQVWDVVISDYSMPRFSAPLALALVKKHKLDLPFIIVSGTVGEDIAVEAIHAGANDFMAKGKLARLVPAVERELRDVTLRAEGAKMQAQLLMSDRMASVGTLAAGVAHEINNPLAAVMANLHFVALEVAELMRGVGSSGAGPRRTGTSEGVLEWVATRLREIDEPMRDASEAAERIRHIVRDLKIFSRSNDEQTGAVDVQRVIDSALRLAWNELRHRARLVKEYGDVPPVEGNEGRLGQVFLNLIMNAVQAIPDGRADRNEIRVVTLVDELGRVVVEVRDTGAGIPASIISQIFDPFFTTKPIGEGTGLGLAITRSIIVSLGGQLTVESELGKGTVVRTLLRVAKDRAVELPPTVAPVAAAPGRRGRILAVDDEPMLGSVIRRTLAADHDVFTLTSAREAIERIAAGERFDIILCDLMMPDVTGMDLHAELVRLAPEQAEKLVFMTGGAFTSRAREFLDTVQNPRVEKPFEAGSLKALIRGLLR